VDDVMEKVALTPWATRWEDVFALEVTPKLVVVWAASAAEARRESGMIDHEFFPATPDDVSEWEDETSDALSDEDIRALARMLSKELRRIARHRAKDYAAEVGWSTRGAGRFVLTPEGIRELERRGGVLLDLIIEAGVPATAVSLRSPDHYRATVLALVRGKLDAALGHDDEEADDGEEGDDDADA
jgi:hypothetical protein